MADTQQSVNAFNGILKEWPNDHLIVDSSFSKETLILEIAKIIYTNNNFQMYNNAKAIAKSAFDYADIFYKAIPKDIKSKLKI